MKKVICLCASALLLGSGSMFAQGEMDAYKFSQYDLNGTARYLSMGGAFGAPPDEREPPDEDVPTELRLLLLLLEGEKELLLR